MDKDRTSTVPSRHVLGRPIIYRLGIRFIGSIPRALAYWGAARVADISYLFCTVARSNVKRNLRRAMPELGQRDIARLALATFRNYSGYLVDYGLFKELDSASLKKVFKNNEGDGNADWALKAGRGIIVLTVHIGNWELGALYFSHRDINIQISVVAAHEGVAEIDALKREYRRRHGVDTVMLGDSPFSTLELLAVLQRGEVVALLVDRYSGEGGHAVATTFFSRPFKFPKGPLLLAKITGAAILPSVVIKKDGAYCAIIGSPVLVDDDADAALEKTAREILESFEKSIRKDPDQWYNFVEV